MTSTPSGCKASFTALKITAGGAMAPPSPMPLMPKAVYGRGRLHVIDPHGRDLGCTRQQVIRESRGERLAVAVIAALLVHRGPDALRHAAQGLAVDHHRIDQRSAVFGDDVVENLHVAELGVDRDHCGMRCIAERPGIHFRAKAHCRFEPAEVDIGRKPLRPQIPGFRHLAQRNRALRPDNGTILVTRRRRGRTASDARRSRRNEAAAPCTRLPPRRRP